jgi:hypothetical protein
MAANPTAFALDAPMTTQSLHSALNLGWSMAELRGRLRYGHRDPPGTVDYQFPRELHALPLGGEHSLDEQLIATRVAVSILADYFGVDQPSKEGEDPPSTILHALARDLGQKLDAAEAAEAGATEDPPKLMDAYPRRSAVGRAWNKVTDAIYRWDEQIQDRLSVSVELLSAYQLGRGLAEAFWALDPEACSCHDRQSNPPRPCSWEFLLGPHRSSLLTSHLRRLEQLLPAMSASAVNGPLAHWTKLVTDGDVRKHDDAINALRDQLQLWRDVLLGARNPLSLAKDYGFRTGARQARRVLNAFRLEITIASISIAALAGAGFYISENQTSTGWTTAITIIGLFGVTGAGLLARAKTQAEALYVRLRAAFYQDVISEKATILPKGVRT